MMMPEQITPPQKAKTGLGEMRRKFVKRRGKQLFRTLGNIMSRQSKVGDMPILDAGHFPFLQEFTTNRQKIRARSRPEWF